MRMCVKAVTPLMLAVLLVCLLSSCSSPSHDLTVTGDSSRAQDQAAFDAVSPCTSPVQPTSASPSNGLQAMLSPEAMLSRLNFVRGASFTLADGYRDGSDFGTALPNNRAFAAALTGVYAPAYSRGDTLGELAYAIYDFTLPDYDATPVSISLSWSDPPPQSNLYVGLGNFAGNRWAWFPGKLWHTVPGGSVLAFADFGDFISSDDTCLLAIVITGTYASVLSNIHIVVKQLPVASLTADATSGQLPFTVKFDASGSTDSDGTIIDYEWDLDGNGTYNEAGAEAAAHGQSKPAPYIYDAAGLYNVRVRVTDNDMRTDRAQLVVSVGTSVPPLAVLQADVTSGFKPLAVNFDASASTDSDGTIEDYEWDFDGNGIFNEAAGGEDAARGLTIPATVTYNKVGVFNATVRITDNTGDTGVAFLPITVDNQPPNAVLQTDVNQGEAPLAVNFNASASTDPGGTIEDYEWDFNGNAVFNETGAEADARGLPTPPANTYTSGGVFLAAVRVTDDDGASSNDTVTITVHGWNVITVDAPEGLDAGYDICLKIVNGNPAIAHVTQTGRTLRYLRSATPSGLDPEDWTVVTLDNINNPQRCSLAVIAGNPAISYYRDSVSGGLLYTRSTTAAGMLASDWIAPVEVDVSGPNRGSFTSLAEVGGNPAIAYTDGSNADLRYARSSTGDGALATDWSNVLVDGSASSVGEWPSLAVVAGNPAIAYVSATDLGIRYARSTTANGLNETDWSGGTHTNVATFTAGATHPSLMVINNNPAVAFQDLDSFFLRYSRSNGPTGGAGSWTTQVTVDNGASTGAFASLGVINLNVAIAYYDETNHVPRYVRATTRSGGNASAWNNKMTIPVTGSAGSYTSLAGLPGGLPAVAFRNNDTGTVMYAVRN